MNVKPGYAFDCAKEFTIAAIENSMITPSEDPKETAKDIVTFFSTIFTNLTEENSEG